MRSPRPVAGTASDAGLQGARSAPDPTRAPDPIRGAADRVSAARGPIPEPVPVTGRLASPIDLPLHAEGRRILSTAFVRVGPDGHLTVELRDGHILVLRDVTMRRQDYCGVRVPGGAPGIRFCGGYADVAAARPGGAPLPPAVSPATEAVARPKPLSR